MAHLQRMIRIDTVNPPGNELRVAQYLEGTLKAEGIATERGARTLAVDEKTHRVFLSSAKSAPAAAGARPTFLPDSFKVLIVGK